MKVESILENFDVVVEAPGGLKSIRELILKLATEGQLVSQDAADKTPEVVAVVGHAYLPPNWSWVSIGSIATFINGYAFPSGDFRSAGTGVVRMSDLKDGQISRNQIKRVANDYLSSLSESLHIRPGDLVIGMSGSIGRPCFNRTNETFLLNQRVGKFHPNEKVISTAYLAIVLATLEPHFLRISAGSGIKNLSTKQIKEALIPLPPFTEQRRIVAKLDRLMLIYDQLEEQKKHRDNIRTAARESALDALTSATTAEEVETAWKRINNNWDVVVNTPESIDSLRSLILDLYTTRQIGRADALAPRSLSEVVELFNGDRSASYPSKDQRVASGVPFINAGHLQNGQVEMENMDYITLEKFNSLKGGKVQIDDILFCLRGSLGKCAIVKDLKQGTVASSLVILRPNYEVIPAYLLRFLQSGSCIRQIKKYNNGSAQPNLAAKNLSRFEIYLPSLTDQQRIIARVDELMALSDQLEAQLKIQNKIAEQYSQSVVSEPFG